MNLDVCGYIESLIIMSNALWLLFPMDPENMLTRYDSPKYRCNNG